MTPKSANEVNYLESQKRYSHQSRSQKSFQTDPDIKELPQFHKLCFSIKTPYFNKNNVEKMATLSHDALNDRVVKIIQSILNLDNSMILRRNLLHRKRLRLFQK